MCGTKWSCTTGSIICVSPDIVFTSVCSEGGNLFLFGFLASRWHLNGHAGCDRAHVLHTPQSLMEPVLSIRHSGTDLRTALFVLACFLVFNEIFDS